MFDWDSIIYIIGPTKAHFKSWVMLKDHCLPKWYRWNVTNNPFCIAVLTFFQLPEWPWTFLASWNPSTVRPGRPWSLPPCFPLLPPLKPPVLANASGRSMFSHENTQVFGAKLNADSWSCFWYTTQAMRNMLFKCVPVLKYQSCMTLPFYTSSSCNWNFGQTNLMYSLSPRPAK